MQSYSYVTLELNSASPNPIIVEAHQWDNLSRYIDVKITKNGVGVTFNSDITATFDAVSSTGVILASDVSASVNVSANKITILLREVMLSIPGILRIDLKIKESNTLVTAQTLLVKVAPAVINENSRTEPYGGTIKEQLDNKADKATTLAGYGITDAYTKTQVDNKLANKISNTDGSVHFSNLNSDVFASAIEGGNTRVVRSTTVYSALQNKANVSDVDACEKTAKKVSNILEITDRKENYPSIDYLDNYFYNINENYSRDEVDSYFQGKFAQGTTQLDMDTLLTDCQYYRVSSLVSNLPSDMPSSVVFIFVYKYGNYVHQIVYSFYATIVPTIYSRFCNTDGAIHWYPWKKANVDTTFSTTSTNAVANNLVTNALNRKADYETGSIISDNIAWYSGDNSKVMTGTYGLNGDYCTISGRACFVQGWVDVYYSLPVAASQYSGQVVHWGDDNYSISTTTLSNISVMHIRSVYGNAQPSGCIDFTFTYKYR